MYYEEYPWLQSEDALDQKVQGMEATAEDLSPEYLPSPHALMPTNLFKHLLVPEWGTVLRCYCPFLHNMQCLEALRGPCTTP